MAAHRYWRIYVESTCGHAICAMQEVEMRASIGGPNVCLSGMVTASSTHVDTTNWPLGVPVTNLFDGNKTLQTSWWACASGQLPCWIMYQFLAPVEIVEIELTPRVPATSNTWDIASYVVTQMLKVFRLDWSDDNNTWTAACYYQYASWVAGVSVSFPVTENPRHSLAGPCDDRSHSGGTIGQDSLGGFSAHSQTCSICQPPPVNNPYGLIASHPSGVPVIADCRNTGWGRVVVADPMANFDTSGQYITRAPGVKSLLRRGSLEQYAKTVTPRPSIFSPCLYGNGRIVGKVTADKLPVKRRVLLVERSTNQVVADCWPGNDGRYSFELIDERFEYMVFSEDHARLWNSVVADYVKPEIM